MGYLVTSQEYLQLLKIGTLQSQNFKTLRKPPLKI